MISGVDTQYIDPHMRAQDDFYRHVNGGWLQSTQIPADKPRYGAFDKLGEDTLVQLRTLIEELQNGDLADADAHRIVDLYASFMDEAQLERLNLQPLAAPLSRIAALDRPEEIPAMIGYLSRIGVSAPYQPQVHQDARDATRYVFDLSQGGLGLPDRDYYLTDEPRLRAVRGSYRQHVERMLRLAGEGDAPGQAAAILEIETALAQAQWTRVENRDPVKVYNRIEIADLPQLMPDHDWGAYLHASGVAGRVSYLIVSQPSYLGAFNSLLQRWALPAWQAYFRWRVLSAFAPYLGRRFDDESFAFYGTALRGIEQQRARWKRGVALVDAALGEALGRFYVARYFPPAHKRRMDELVRNLLAAYRSAIGALEWMGPETRERAQQKLARFSTKIGYPSRWRDYTALRIEAGDLAGNVLRANEFDYERNLAKLGAAVDREEWHMNAQTVNAYYNPEMNEIVFPAAILQPPFFNAVADDAVNYGGIGAVIGHEISHGFDDQGSQYDGAGNLLDPPGWFSPEDLERFRARTRTLIEQYAAFAPVPGFPINGELTLGENIADNSGLSIAYQAYRLSLGGREPPVIDGLTGDQRFFMGWAQVWRAKSREEDAIMRIKSDPHAPPEFRGALPERNLAPFYTAFDVREGDGMYLPPERRVTIW
jgi:predicted metalloendopeptidase